MKIEQIINEALDAAKRFIKWILPSSKKMLDIAIDVVNGIKNFDDANGDIVNFLTAIIPGTVDDLVVAKIREYLPEVLTRLKWAEMQVEKSADEIVAKAAVYINSLPQAERSGCLQLLWQLISNRLTDDGVSMSDLQKIGQYYFMATKEKK